MESMKKINANIIKMIAIITMFIDHLGATLVWEYMLTLQGEARMEWYTIYMVMRKIGRLAFPIYCFFIVEGLEHTRSVKKYITRLLIFAVISEIPFDYAFQNKLTLGYQNVFFTLTIGLLCIWGVREVEERITDNIKQIVFKTLIIAAGIFLANLLNTDYGGFGVLMIAILYLFQKSRLFQCIFGAAGFAWEVTAPISFLLLYFYNGEKGKNVNKYFFYAFYPVHLAILALVKIICFGG